MDKVWWKQARLAAKEMNKKVKKGNLKKDAVTLFAYAHKDSVGVSGTQYCHAGLSHVGKGSIAIVNSIQTYHGHDLLTQEERELFLQWLANESSFSQVFVSKSAKQMLKQGHAFLRTDVPGPLLGGACVAMRFLWENANKTVAWVDLVNGGMDKAMAFLICHCITQTGTRTGSAYVSNDMYSNHVVFDSMSTKGLKNFITGTLTCTTETYQATSRYRGYGRSLFDGDGDGGNFMNKLLGQYKPNKVKKKVNPFKQEAEDGVAYSDCIAELLRLKDELLEDVMNA